MSLLSLRGNAATAAISSRAEEIATVAALPRNDKPDFLISLCATAQTSVSQSNVFTLRASISRFPFPKRRNLMLFSRRPRGVKTAPSLFFARTLAFFALAIAATTTTQHLTAQNASRVLDLTLNKSQAKTKAQTPTRARQGNPRLATLEADLIARVNVTRRSLKLSTLRHDPLLAEVARAHSLEMRDKKYFAHESPTAGLVNPLDRYRAGFRDTPAIVAENIYRAWSTARTVPSESDILRAHNALLKSPGHRKNIVEPRVTNIGVGIVQNANGDIWITQMFSRPTW